LLAYFKQQNKLGEFPLILLVCFSIEKATKRKVARKVDPEDT